LIKKHKYAGAVLEHLSFHGNRISGVHSTFVDRNHIHHFLAIQHDIGGHVRKHPRWVPLWIGEVEFIFFFVPIEGWKNASARGGGHDLKRLDLDLGRSLDLERPLDLG
jgi:hypothetical protein